MNHGGLLVGEAANDEDDHRAHPSLATAAQVGELQSNSDLSRVDKKKVAS